MGSWLPGLFCLVHLCVSLDLPGLSLHPNFVGNEATASLLQVRGLSLCLSLSLCLCLSLCISLYICLSMNISVCLSVSIYISVCLSRYVYLCPSVCLCLYLCLSVCLYVYLCMSVSLCISLYVCLSMYISVCLSPPPHPPSHTLSLLQSYTPSFTRSAGHESTAQLCQIGFSHKNRKQQNKSMTTPHREQTFSVFQSFTLEKSVGRGYRHCTYFMHIT